MRVLSAILVVGLVAASTHADQLIRGLSELQAVNGGFHEVGAPAPDLIATSHALFLTVLYGQSNQINADDAHSFVQSMETESYGYTNMEGTPADIEATRAALLSYIHLKQDIPNQDQVSQYITGLFNVQDGLFGPKSGEPGDIKSTAMAFECLEILGALERPAVAELLERVKDVISAKAMGTETLSFSDDVSENRDAIYLAKISGFEFVDLDKWVAGITSLQNVDSTSPMFGGFFTDTSRTQVTARATADAALSLKYLDRLLGVEYPLYKYASITKPRLSETAASHLTMALTPFFKGSFKTQVGYDTNAGFEVGEQVMEGLKLTPKALVAALDGKVAHGGFDLSVKLVDSSGSWGTDLTFDTSTFIYNGNAELDTTDMLGSITFEYTLLSNVYPIGEIRIIVTDTKKVGYAVNVDTEMVHDGNTLSSSDPVVPGTEFDFAVSLSTQIDRDFYQGDFVLTMEVMDASSVVQYTETINGADNMEPIALAYTLDGNDFPRGDVNFVFTVSNDVAGAHTVKTVTHTFEVEMTASSVVFSPSEGAGDQSYGLGESMEVSMTPASVVNGQAVPFNAANSDSRSFAMDVVSKHGTVIATAEGRRQESGFVFAVEVPATLEAVGMAAVSFRFIADDQDHTSTPLVVEAETAVSVAAALEMTSITDGPSVSDVDFTYGTSIAFSFHVTDRLTGSDVSLGESGSVAFVLSSDEQGTESARINAAPTGPTGFGASVTIDANAVAGASTLSLQAFGVDGEEVSVFVEGSDTPVTYKGTVGGEIDVDHTSYSTKAGDAIKTSFISTFSLSCGGQPLSNARVTASLMKKDDSSNEYAPVKRSDALMVGLPVAVDSEGGYSFSVTMPHEEAVSGGYKIEFQRVSDEVTMFEVPLVHTEVQSSGLWMQMELATSLVLFAVFLGVSTQATLFERVKTA